MCIFMLLILFNAIYIYIYICILYRYEGEESEEVKDEVKNESDRINKLLKRIEKNKKRKAAINDKSKTEDEKDNNKSEISLKESKKKKRKLPAIEEEIDSYIKSKDESKEEIDEQTVTENVEPPKKKKRKKKDIENEDHSVLEENEQPQKKNESSTNEKELASQDNFMILGAKARKKQHEIKRVLPDWLTYPEIISTDLKSGPSIEELNSVLDIKLIEALKTNGITKLFPMQYNIIKWLHKCNIDRKLQWWPRDTCVSAPTGSGMQ